MKFDMKGLMGQMEKRKRWNYPSIFQSVVVRWEAGKFSAVMTSGEVDITNDVMSFPVGKAN
jgi:hypothetical protein